MSQKKSYSELCNIDGYAERLHYLKLTGKVGDETFGRARPMNQIFYQSRRWKDVRDKVLVRDRGRDLGVEGRELNHHVIVHHINPITDEDLENDADCLYDMENLITVSNDTHNAIHYGTTNQLDAELMGERQPNDTCPWK